MLTLIHGTDSYRIREACDALVAPHRELVRIDCTDASAQETLHRNLKYPSFFGEVRCILATNAAHESFEEILDTYELNELSDVVLIAVQDTSGKSFDKKILTKIQKVAQSVSLIAPLEGVALTAWMTTYCADRDAQLSPEVAKFIVQGVGADTRKLALELDKLCAYAQGESLTTTVVRELIHQQPERDEWELSNAIAAHDKRAVIAALWRKLNEGSAEQMVLGSLAAGLRNLIMIQNLTTRNQSSAHIAKTTGLHPFVISKSLAGARTADVSRLSRAHIALALLDRGSKDGRMDVVDGLYAVLLAL